jgi:hypothetical protein
VAYKKGETYYSSFKKFQQDDTVQYFIISCKSLYMFRAYPMLIMRSSINCTDSIWGKQCVSSRRRGELIQSGYPYATLIAERVITVRRISLQNSDKRQHTVRELKSQ